MNLRFYFIKFIRLPLRLIPFAALRYEYNHRIELIELEQDKQRALLKREAERQTKVYVSHIGGERALQEFMDDGQVPPALIPLKCTGWTRPGLNVKFTKQYIKIDWNKKLI